MSTNTSTPSVNTSKVTGRRTLHFYNFDEVLADVENLSKVPVHCLGNWSLGQILQHLSIGLNSSIDGSQIKPPFLLRILGPLFKNRILKKGMTPGFKIPADAAKILIPGDTETEAGLQAFRAAIARCQTETQRAPSPFLGKLTREESDQLHLRHCELHLSFVVPEAG